MRDSELLFSSRAEKSPDYYNPLDMSGRTILVTGASSGIGRALAILLSQVGAQVIVTGRDRDRLHDTLEQMCGSGHLGSVFDIAKTDGITDWLQAICAQVGALDGVAHCAGMIGAKPLKIIDVEFINKIININLTSAMMIAQALRLKSCHKPSATLVFVSSSAALKSAPGNSVYAATKGGIIALTKSLGIELLRDGIRVNCVAPGMVDTPMSAHFKKSVTDDNFQKIVDMHPLGLGQPEDIAKAILYLLADTSKWITGSTLRIDGGFLS